MALQRLACINGQPMLSEREVETKWPCGGLLVVTDTMLSEREVETEWPCGGLLVLTEIALFFPPRKKPHDFFVFVGGRPPPKRPHGPFFL